MTTDDWRQLAIDTVTDPRNAAQTVMQINLSREGLWTALALAAVLNTLLFTISNILMPTSGPVPPVFDMPVFYFGFVAGGLVLMIYAVFWTGRMFGGQGTLDEIMALLIWLQALRVAVQAVILVLMMVMPALAALVVFAVGVVGLWILVHFVDQGHRLGSFGKSAGVLIAAFLAMALILSIVLSMFGASLVLGDASYV